MIPPIRRAPQSLSPVALVTAAAVTAFFMGGRATRDALFLSVFRSTDLPVMYIATAIASVALVYAASLALTRWGPHRALPAAFGASAVLLMGEWGLSFVAYRPTAVIAYLHFSGLGAVLISGFWSFLNERLDPRTAKRQIGRVAAAGTIGGIVGGLLAFAVPQPSDPARVWRAVAAMLPVLAAVHLVCFVGMTLLRRSALEAGSARIAGGAPENARIAGPERGVAGAQGGPAPMEGPMAGTPEAPIAGPPSRAGIRALTSSPYLRGLVLLVLFLGMAECLIDLVLKGRAQAVLSDVGYLHFFAKFYTGTAILTAVVQLAASGFVLKRLGPARSAALAPAVCAVTAAGALGVPGLWSAVVARGTELVLSSSLYRAGYEVLFTPVATRDKRAVKGLVDVGAARAGDLLGGALAWGVLWAPASTHWTILLALAVGLSVIALVVAIRLQRGYVDALERGLISKAIHLKISDATDSVTLSTFMKTIQVRPPGGGGEAKPAKREPERPESEEERRARVLQSSDSAAIRLVLATRPVPEALVPQVATLLAWNEVAREAIEALSAVGRPAVEPLVRRLLDPDTDFTIRRRIPLVLGAIPDARAVDGLLRGLSDRRFEVRYRCGRAIAHLQSLDSSLAVPSGPVVAAVLREVETSAGVWEGRDLLDRMGDDAWSPVVDELVRNRAGRSLEHVFTLLALVYPRGPLRIAFRGLHTDDPMLRGTALEYLETTLPPTVRKALWPYLERDEDRTRRRAPGHTKEEALTQLLRVDDSIAVRLEELRRKE